MAAQTFLRIKPALTAYLHEFDDCFGRSQTRGHMVRYVQGQLSDLPRKSVEPMADAAGVPPRTLQEFLSLSRWDEPRLRDRLQQRVARRHAHEQAVGIIDETSFPKKGDKTAGVQRQHCGAVGKKDNCVVSVHLGYATPGSSARPAFHTLLDGELYLPDKTWDQNPQRRRQAAVPEDVRYQPKWRMALTQYRRAVGNGVRFRWLTFDEFYGGNTQFLRELDALGQDYVAEVPRDFHVWTSPPPVLHRRHSRDLRRLGRPRQYPRLKVKHNPTIAVEHVLRYSPRLRRQPWVKYHVKDGAKGPMIWEVKHLWVYLKDERGLPTGGGRAYHLLVTRDVLSGELKYFISNAGEATAVANLLLVAFSRWKIERMFADSKMELGLDHFEVRQYGSISRHLLLGCVSHLFLAEFHQQQRGEKSVADDQPTGDSDRQAGAAVGAGWPLFAAPGSDHRGAINDNAAAQRPRCPQPPQANDPTIAHHGHSTDRLTRLSMAQEVAL